MALTPSGNFAQKLLGALVQFGKGFANLQGVSATQLAVRNAGNTANAKLTVAAGTAPTDAVNLSQLGAGGSSSIEVDFTSADFGGGSKSSTATIPLNATVLSVALFVDIAFDTGTVAIGDGGNASRYAASGDTDLTSLGAQGGPSGVVSPGTVALMLTFGGGPSTGTARVVVTYATPAT